MSGLKHRHTNLKCYKAFGNCCPPWRRVCSRTSALAVAAEALSAQFQAEDKWIAQNISPFLELHPSTRLATLKKQSQNVLATQRMPSTRNEEFRFTDISPLLRSSIQPADSSTAISTNVVEAHVFPEASSSVAVVVNGGLRRDLSNLQNLPEGAYVGSIQGAPATVAETLGQQANTRGGPFAVLNGAAAQDVLCVFLPAGLQLEQPLHILYVATGGSDGTRSGNAPRLLVYAASGAAGEVIEEYVAADSNGQYFSCSVAEVVLCQGARLKHGYVQREAGEAYHFRSTLVSQDQGSQYTLIESSTGGSLTRHDLGIEQVGPDTETQMRHFLLCGNQQLHDLHSKLQLNHPRGVANQIHKCIVSHSTGRGVFDGNVKVNRLAQKTDAGQLSRNLLLVPKATVNVKPNLQIIADDVKCTHGCAVSDLSDEELFYFRARGISSEAARKALVLSFGAEVVQNLKYPKLLQRIQADVGSTLRETEMFSSA